MAGHCARGLLCPRPRSTFPDLAKTIPRQFPRLFRESPRSGPARSVQIRPCRPDPRPLQVSKSFEAPAKTLSVQYYSAKEEYFIAEKSEERENGTIRACDFISTQYFPHSTSNPSFLHCSPPGEVQGASDASHKPKSSREKFRPGSLAPKGLRIRSRLLFLLSFFEGVCSKCDRRYWLFPASI